MEEKFIIILDLNNPYLLKLINGKYTKENLVEKDGKYFTENGTEVNDENSVIAPPTFKYKEIMSLPFHDSFIPVNYNDLYQTFKNYLEKESNCRDPSENFGNDLLTGIFGLVRSSVPKTLVSLFKLAPRKATNSVLSLLSTIATNSPKRLAQKATSKVLETAIRETPRIGLGIVGSNAVDKVSEATTGKTFGENITDELSARYRTNVSPIIGELLNPGGYLGYNYMDKAIRKAIYNLVTPFGYSDEIVYNFPTILGKKREGLKVLLDIFNPKVTFKKVYTPTDARTKPAWRKRLESDPNYSDIRTNIADDLMYNRAVLDNRDAALILALRLDKPKLYSYNGDGTFSYNIDNAYILKTFPLLSPYIKRNSDGTITLKDVITDKGYYFDNITTNGGIVLLLEYPNGKRIMSDVYDLLPYIDLNRPTSLPFKKIMNKTAPDFEVLNAVGGTPFTLRHSYNVNNPIKINLEKSYPYLPPRLSLFIPNLIDIIE